MQYMYVHLNILLGAPTIGGGSARRRVVVEGVKEVK